MNLEQEEARLKELDSYSILDTVSDDDYDNITALASEICQIPISLISLVDKERQWFKSHHGLEVAETPRIHSFCANAIQTPDEIYTVPDARKHELYKRNPLVTDYPNIVFYAGVPLITPKGHALGTLCVIDQKPRELTAGQMKALRALSSSVMKLLELRKTKFRLEFLNARLEEKNKILASFADLAHEKIDSPLFIIQNSLEEMQADDKKTVKEYADKVNSMRSATSLLSDMVIALKEHAKLGVLAKNDRELVDLAELGEELKALFPDKDDVKIALNFHVHTVSVNRLVLKEIFTELISNAVRHNEKPFIEIEIGGRELYDVFEFFVADNGPGIPEKDHKTIRQMFVALNPIGRFGEFGLGVGLSHVHHLIQELDGEMCIDSDEGEGTIVSFSIPKS